jgi:hypothetical protein
VRRVAWLRRHRRITAVPVSAGILATFGLSLLVSSEFVTGLYLVPLTLVAVTESELLVAAAGVGCALVSLIELRTQGHLDAQAGLLLGYDGLYVLGLVVLAYLVNRLTRISHYAELRAQMAEASADVTAVSGNRADLAELLQYAVERIGGEVGASAGLVLLLEQEEWTGLAGYGLGADARALQARFADVPVAVRALETDKATVVAPVKGDARVPAEITARLGLEQLLVAPMLRQRRRRHRLQPRPGDGAVHRRRAALRRKPGALHRRGYSERATHGGAQRPATRPGACARFEP